VPPGPNIEPPLIWIQSAILPQVTFWAVYTISTYASYIDR